MLFDTAGILFNFRASLIFSKHQLEVLVVEPTSPELVQYDLENGKICLKLRPGIKSTLKLKIKNGNSVEKQEVDDKEQKLGLVIKSIDFLRTDNDFKLTGTR